MARIFPVPGSITIAMPPFGAAAFNRCGQLFLGYILNILVNGKDNVLPCRGALGHHPVMCRYLCPRASRSVTM